MPGPPPLRTDRLRLDPPTPEDRAFGVRLHRDPQVRRHLGGPVPEDRLPGVLAGYLALGPCRAAWVVRTAEDGAPVGLVSLSEHHGGPEIELSYQFLPAAWGRGLAAEAARAAIAHAAGAMRLSGLVAETQSANHRSRRLLERLGMTERASFERFGAMQTLYAMPLDGPALR